MRLAIDLDPATVRRLSDRARRHGRSLSEEARALIDRDSAARGPGETETDNTPSAADLLAGFERFRRAAPEPSLAALRRARDGANSGPNGERAE